MDQETEKYDAEFEEGELSDSCGEYTPLQRPDLNLREQSTINIKQQQQQIKMDEGLRDTIVDDSPSDFGPSSDSSSDSDDVIYAANSGNDNEQKMKKKSKKRTIQYAKQTNIDSSHHQQQQQLQQEQNQQSSNKFKKYNIWTASMQEESLSENMRGIDVNKYPKNDRNVESYDFSWKYKLDKRGGGGGFKRRLSTHSDDDDDDDICNNDTTSYYSHESKRLRNTLSSDHGGQSDWKLSNKKSKLDRRESTSSYDSQNTPRHILDLTVNLESDDIEIARDIANKLNEEKDELMLRAVEVLGKEMPITIFKETQRIEKDGGMMTMNGIRRRTPGGVFLFLLKHHDDITAENKELIFCDDMKTTNEKRKTLTATKRDRKVEELKKQLSLKEKQLSATLSSKRSVDITTAMCHLKPDTHANLSNPPPSPVTNGGLESSPDYSSHAINHVNDASPGKLSLLTTATTTTAVTDRTNVEGLVTYDDDEFVDMNYSDMDLF